VGGSRLILEYGGRLVVDMEIEELESVWRRALPKLLS
jgi:hypothetical protein